MTGPSSIVAATTSFGPFWKIDAESTRALCARRLSDVTPEPSTFFLFGTGAVLLGAKYRYRVRSAGQIV
jgi:hypothetical protein